MDLGCLSSLKKDADGNWIVPDGQRFVTESGIALEPMRRQIMPAIDGPPMDLDGMYKQACANDDVTVNSWKDQWSFQIRDNVKYDFVKNSVAQLLSKEKFKPIILAGSGPSLKRNTHQLQTRKDIRIVSCLHNFGYFEDREIMGTDDYYLSLDAGDITIREVVQGGTKEDESWYWERTKDRTLICHVCTNPDLLRRWKGPKYFFCTPFAPQVQGALGPYVDLSKTPFFNCGGNALGACMYFGKAILGGSTMIFIGADFAFDLTNSFHPFASPYDSMFRGVIPATNIWGNRVYTWQSYYNFKVWFEYMACGGKGRNPISMINATEGGILGAYPQGNIKQIVQMDLNTALYQYHMIDKQPELIARADKNPVLLF